jgi:Raf kinase inhibitor-like YbhB/YbcL family protein
MGLNIKDLTVESPAFAFGQPIPTKHTKEGEDVQPELRWRGVPEGTRSIAVVCHDPDAPLPDGFTHWVVYGIPADVTSIAEDKGSQYTEGQTDFGETGYGGPMPPDGHGTHHYYFWVYALDTELNEGAGLTRAELLERMEGHILEQNRLVGTYER